MVKAVVVGSVALDSIRTPFGEVHEALGGSASYAGYASSFFSKTGIVGVVGSDFPKKHLDLFKRKGIDLSGLSFADGKTFRWHGYYEFDLNQAHTVKTELNVFEEFQPVLPDSYRKAKFLFLGNIGPELQLNVLGQMASRPKLVVADTMNYWIEKSRETVLEVVKAVDIMLFNDAEARQLFRTPSIVKAARMALALDSDYAIIKKGEHGALMFTPKSHFSAPAYPLENIVDPTGAGDCFGGAMTGYLAKTGSLTEKNLRKAIIFGSAVASLDAEGFSLENLKKISLKDIEARVQEFKEIVHF
ncbi:MAG: hypothetical protein QT03_C0001G0342 [archaeon GW2011_AR10]|uniref:Sugar kinase n=2 Tax=Candidatus Iainarchaeum sp. TaxID=3101447 RepID=A0A7J4IQL7_9ARCH|nr:MAG: hypothetical protein QT03_C0001G0342 [archaeon GW2011_AR10]HIH07793.1 sugar kinase [Candidatus Diapherotrites archaeon]